MIDQNSNYWKDYEVLATGPYRENEVVIKRSEEKMKTNEVIQKSVDQMWSQMIKGRAHVGLETWDNVVYRLNGYKEKEGKLELTIGEATFKELQGTNATNWIFGDIYGHDYLANGLLVMGLVKDNKGSLVLGRRNTGVKPEFEPYVIFGGTMDKADKHGNLIDHGENPFKAMRIELKEELGVNDDYIADIYIQWLVTDYKYYPILVFVIELNLGFEELNTIFKENGDDEHTKILHVHKSFLQSLVNDSPEKVRDGTLMALDLWLGME